MNFTIVAMAIGAIIVALVVVSGLVSAGRKLDDVLELLRQQKDPDRSELGRRLAVDQRPLPEIVEVSRPVRAAPRPVIWGGTVVQAEQLRRALRLGPETPAFGDGSLRSIEGRRIHVVLVTGTAGQSPDGVKMREVLVRSGMKTSPEGAVFLELDRLS